LARDPLGIKPLYIARNPDPDSEWSLIFASELRAILASGLIHDRRLDPRAVASVLWNGFVAGPGTAVRGIESVWPSQVRVFDTRGKEKSGKYYWSVPPRQAAQTMEEQEFARELEKSVRLHLVSDVPVAVFLSAGVDSSAVANLAQKASSDPIHTFTLAFEEHEYNEGQHARRIADAIGTQHREVVLSERHFIDQLDAALDSLDQPTFDGINSYYMSHSIREAGFKVALVGTGGDELFGGYKSFIDLPILLKWIRRARWLSPRIKREAATLISSLMQPSRGAFGPQTRWAKFPAMIERGDNLLGLYQLAYALFLPKVQGELLAGGGAGVLADGLCDEMRSRLSFETQSLTSSPLATIGVLEQRLFLGERLLRDTDAASMASSVELRLPLVDHVLLESVGCLEDRLRFHPVGKKQLLRRIGLRGLDPALFERPKTGFVLPFDRWIRSGLGKAMDATMRDATAVRAVGLDANATTRLWQAFLDKVPGIYWSRVWAVFVLIRWCQRHKVYI
jgi:asparagine synthase (glutamine-hydrolysing)